MSILGAVPKGAGRAAPFAVAAEESLRGPAAVLPCPQPASADDDGRTDVASGRSRAERCRAVNLPVRTSRHALARRGRGDAQRDDPRRSGTCSTRRRVPVCVQCSSSRLSQSRRPDS